MAQIGSPSTHPGASALPRLADIGAVDYRYGEETLSLVVGFG